MTTAGATTGEAMSDDAFWQLVEQSRSTAQDHGAGRVTERQVEALREELAGRTAQEVAAFQHTLAAQSRRAYTWDLWGAAYVALGGAGDDAFTDVRTWLVMHGRETFERVLVDPDAFADLEWDEAMETFGDAEEFGYVAAEVHEELTGAPLPDDVTLLEPDVEPAGEPFGEDEETLRERYPRTWARHGP